MKRLLAVILVLTMMLSFAACGSKPASVEGSMEELLNKVIQQKPVEFAGGVMPIDLTDSSEDGKWMLKSFTGLEDGSQLTEAAAFEPMIGSIAFSMVMVRTASGVDPKAVAERMKSGVNPRKWICVEADDMLVAGWGDVVMLIMVSSSSDLTAQAFVDAFKTVAGRDCDFVI